MRKTALRAGIILFWVCLIAVALYLPKWGALNDKKSLYIFTWGDILEPSVISDFEKETGIKVHLNYYSSNEELLVKLRATRGVGYDLIIPSDYAVEQLIREELLQELDRTKLDFWQGLNPLLLGQHFDPTNRYSIPFEWEIYGLGINKEILVPGTFKKSWELIFSAPNPSYRVAMINDPIETLLFSSFFLYGLVDHLAPYQMDEIRSLLLRQKRWVEAYADFRADYFLATKSAAVAVASSSYIWRQMKLFPFIDFVIPEEGTFITIENLALPKASKKQELTYQFINFLYRPSSIATHYKTFSFFPAALHGLDLLHLTPEEETLIRSTPKAFRKFHFTRQLVPHEQVLDLWVDIKSPE